MEPIDFVILWVDGDDPVWQEERGRFTSRAEDNGGDENRYRDWDLLRYWFRGVEKYAPWVRKVYFVTCGHYPAWLNLHHPKLELVRHEQFIPKENLPVFNSNAIELYLHRLPGLSEHFVLFNDDMFLLRPVEQEDFFVKGLPCECALMDAPAPENPRNVFPHMMLNNAAIINEHFSKQVVLRKHRGKFFCLRYGKGLLRNLLLASLQYFSCFRGVHNPVSHWKRTFEEVWEAEPELLAATGTHRFRSREDVTHWLMKDWRLCQGNFYPRSAKWGRCFELGLDGAEDICRAITHQSYKAICINDSRMDIDFPALQRKLQSSFETLLPERSEFEYEDEQR